jgi:hypothetical protein
VNVGAELGKESSQEDTSSADCHVSREKVVGIHLSGQKDWTGVLYTKRQKHIASFVPADAEDGRCQTGSVLDLFFFVGVFSCLFKNSQPY